MTVRIMIKHYKIKTLTYLYQHFCTFRLNAKINNNNKLITNNRVFEWDKQIINESLCYAKSPIEESFIQAIKNAVLYTRKGRITYLIEMYLEIKKQVTGVETFDLRYQNELESNYKCEK